MSLPRSAGAALRQAEKEVEGLTLLRSESSNTGYKGVSFKSGRTMPYQAQVQRGGNKVNLGSFATAEEAALAYARTPEAQAAAAAAAAPPAPPAPPPMTVEEALRQAETEGLTLLRTESTNSGYKGVSFNSSKKTKPYQAHVWRSGKQVALGHFATAEEAALAYARMPAARAAVTAVAAPPAPPPMTAEEALRQAEAEGLALLRAEGNISGYKGVTFDRNMKTKPYHTRVQRGSKNVSIGHFATAEEAALALARTPEAQAAAAAAAPPLPPPPPPMTAEEALRQAEAEGLTLLRSETTNTGYKGVSLNNSMKTVPYKAQAWRGGKTINLGYFATVEETALVFARDAAAQEAQPQPPAKVATAPPLTADEALRQAEAEGLTLVRSESSSTGYKGVSFDRKMKTKPYKACSRWGGEKMSLGHFATAEEAALILARSPEGQAAVAAAAALAPPPMTAGEALRQAEAEGLTLLKSDGSNTGYKGVSFYSGRPKPYHAQVWRGGKTATLGYFATAEEAALVVARDAAAQAAPPPPPATSSRKRKVKSEEQPPDMPAGARVKLEEQPPPMPKDTVVKLESC